MTRNRLKPEERKVEIQNIALRIFTMKGYKNTSMHDLVQATGLSAGGMYHYYKGTSEILYDLMLRGCQYREDIVTERLQKISQPLSAEELAEIIVDKALLSNPFIPVYVMFLQSMQEDEALRKLYQDLQDSNIRHFTQLIKKYGYGKISDESWRLLNDLINMIILGCETLKIRENLILERSLLEKMIIDILARNRKEV